MTAQQTPNNGQRPAVQAPPAKQATATGPGRMSLANVTRGKLKRAMRVLLYGVDKIGKSTFGAGAPQPLFIGAEDGTSELNVERSPEPYTFEDILCVIDQLINDDEYAGKYKSIVLDTLDWAEPMVWRATCAKGDPGAKDKSPKKHIEDFGFGKGYERALIDWRILLARFDVLRVKRGYHIILLAHAHVKTFKNPMGDDFDRYEPKINQKAAGLMKEWVDACLYAQYESGTVTKGEGLFAKARGISSGARYIYTQRTAAYDAGNRYGLPPKLPLNWQGYEEAVKAGTPEDPVKLLALITSLAEQVDEATRAKVTAWLTTPDAKDPIKLSQAADNLRGKISIKQDNDADDGTGNNNSKEEHTAS